MQRTQGPCCRSPAAWHTRCICSQLHNRTSARYPHRPDPVTGPSTPAWDVGFGRAVLDDTAAVLRCGRYVSPLAEPLPYMDELASCTAALCDVLRWPGLLLLDRGAGGSAGGARTEVLAMLQVRNLPCFPSASTTAVSWQNVSARGRWDTYRSRRNSGRNACRGNVALGSGRWPR